jgi:hypothetical protein
MKDTPHGRLDIAYFGNLWFPFPMSLETLKQKAAELDPAERRKLMGFLASLNVSDDERAALARKVDDNNPEHWLTVEQLDKKLAELDQAEKK